jgi:hypothetical protein
MVTKNATKKTTAVKAARTSSIKQGSLDKLSHKELLAALVARDALIAKLQQELLQASLSPTSAKLEPKKDPAKLLAAVDKLKSMAYRAIRAQMKWKLSLKNGTGRWTWSSLCNEETFRALLELSEKDKTKGKKMTTERFYHFLGKGEISKSVRYDTLYLLGQNVTISYKQDDGEVKINGSYGLLRNGASGQQTCLRDF